MVRLLTNWVKQILFEVQEICTPLRRGASGMLVRPFYRYDLWEQLDAIGWVL